MRIRAPFRDDIIEDVPLDEYSLFFQEETTICTPKCGVSVILPSIHEPDDNASMNKTIVADDLTNQTSQVNT